MKMKSQLHRTFFAVILLCALTACNKGKNSPHPIGFNGVPSKLFEIPSGFEAGEIYFSKEGQRVGVILRKDGKEAMGFSSHIDPMYENVRNAVFCKDGPGSAYVARNAGKEFVINDGRKGSEFDTVSGLVMTADGHIVYTAKAGDKWFVVLDNAQSGPLDMDPQPLASFDGRRVAYMEQHAGTKKHALKVCDAKLQACVTGTEYDSIRGMGQDGAGTRLLFLAQKGGKKAIVTVDTTQPKPFFREGAWYEDLSSVGISPKGNHIAYLARRAGKLFLVRDGVEQETELLSDTLDMQVADNGRTLYTGIQHNRVKAYLDGKHVGNEYSGIHEPTFSNDGSSFAFEATENDKSTIIVNGSAGPTYDKIVTPRFFPDGSRLVYRARQNGARFVVSADNRGRTLKEHPRYDLIWDVTFSPDGKSVGYGVKSGSGVWWKVEPVR